ncbi:MAG: YlbF family regulator [Clostridiales bacterium]|nr:YlbF family regulator [Candidatus Blautia equi]
MDDLITRRIGELLTAITESEQYKRYREVEEILRAHPDYLERVDTFRANNFRLQNDTSHEDLFERAEKLALESKELRKIPEVNAYLDAELAMCKTLQKICKTLVDGVDIHVPEF